MKFIGLSLCILSGIALAFWNPYWGIEWSHMSFYLLLVMGTLNFFSIQWKNIFSRQNQWTRFLFLLIAATLFMTGFQMILARFMFADKTLQLGVLFSTLAPCAIFVPQFFNSDQDKLQRAVFYVILSTFLFPVFLLISIPIFSFENINFKILHLLRDLIFLTLAPIAISFVCDFSKFKARIGHSIRNINPWFNSVIVGALVFIYFSASIAKGKILEMSLFDGFKIVAFALIQDFGAYFIFRLFLKFDRAEALSFSIKNVALAGGILLIFSPNSIVICCAVLFAHSLFLMTMPMLHRIWMRA